MLIWCMICIGRAAKRGNSDIELEGKVVRTMLMMQGFKERMKMQGETNSLHSGYKHLSLILANYSADIHGLSKVPIFLP